MRFRPVFFLFHYTGLFKAGCSPTARRSSTTCFQSGQSPGTFRLFGLFNLSSCGFAMLSDQCCQVYFLVSGRGREAKRYQKASSLFELNYRSSHFTINEMRAKQWSGNSK